MKKICKCLTTLLMVACFIASLNLTAFAAVDKVSPYISGDDGNFVRNKIAVSVDGTEAPDSDVLVTNNQSGAYTITAKDYMWEQSYVVTFVRYFKTQTATLTFTNNYDVEISFDYTVANNEGAITGSESPKCTVEANKITMEPGASFTLKVKSSNNGNKKSQNSLERETGAKYNTAAFNQYIQKTCTFNLSNFQMAETNAAISFVAPANGGSYTVKDADDKSVTVGGNAAKSKYYNLTAAPASGYRFCRWKFTSDKNEVTYFVEADGRGWTSAVDGTITCEFIPKDAAIYTVDGVPYGYLDQAITAATNSSSSPKQIVLIGSGSTIDSNGETQFTIPSDVQLVLPYAAKATTLQSSSASFPYGNYAQANLGNAKWYPDPINPGTTNEKLKLTIPQGTTIVNNGTIAVGATLSGSAAVCGDHATLEVNGELHLYSPTSVLSACGYVIGSGTVKANGLTNAAGTGTDAAGAKIYQPMVLLRVDSHGWLLSASALNMKTSPADAKDGGISSNNPSPRYTTQNIQCNLEMAYGDTLNGYLDQVMSGTHYMTNVPLVGKGTGLIGLKSGTTLSTSYASGKVSDTYPTIGKLTVTITGNGTESSGATQGTMSADLGIEIDMSKWPFPVPYNYDFILKKGTYDLNYDLSLLPGAGLKVEHGATLNIKSGKSLAVFTGANDHSVMPALSKSSSYPTVVVAKGGSVTTDTGEYANALSGSRRYPANRTLGSVSGGTYMANFVVDGMLNINGSFGGIVQTNGTGTINMNVAPKTIYRQLGMTGDCYDSSNSRFAHAGATVYAFEPQVIGVDGQPFTMTAQATYKAANNTATDIPHLAYDLYPNSANTKEIIEVTDEELNATAVGQWYTSPAVIFYANDGTENMAIQEVTAGTAVALNANAFTHSEGLVFAGWNTVKEPTEENPGTAYEDGAEITVTADTTLYAQWKSDECIHEGEKTSEAIKAPTCTIPGLNKITCSDCDEVVAEMAYVSATGHKYVEGVCSVCNHEEAYTWTGKSAVFVGDSITYGAGTDKIYHAYLKETLGFGSVTNMGISSSCISTKSDYGTNNSPLINRYQNIPSANLIVVFMGTNDYGHETPLGTINDEGDVSFYGALNTIIPALVENHPNSKIVFATPLHRYGFGTSKILGTAFTDDNIPNGVGATLGDYVEAVKLVCAKNGVSVIDLHTLSESVPELDPKDANYFPDGLHPNAAGHEIVADIMDDYLLEYAPETLSDLVYGNKFINDTTSQNRLSTRVNMYLRAGTVITLKDSSLEWACAMSTGENTSDRIDNCYFPVDGWAGSQVTATVQKDGWVGITFRKTGDGAFTSDEVKKPLSDYVTIKEPDWVYGNRFAGGEFVTQTNRMSTRVNLYLEAGTTLTLNDADNYKWCCYANSGENTNNNSATIGAGQWNAPKSVKVPSDGWVGIAIAPKNNAEFSVDDLKKPLSDYVTITESELIHGNKFQPDDPQYQTPDRASTRYNLYLEAGTSIKLKDPATFEWACAMTGSEDSKQMIGNYFPDNLGWTSIANATVPNDGWVGIVLRYKDPSKTVDLCTSLSDYVIICKHNYDAEETTAATCLKDGVKTYTCSECGDSYTEAIPATGHTLTQVEAKAPTCTEAGYEAYEFCSVCDYTTYKEVAATGHTLTQVEAKAPTCTEAGYEAYEFCSICDYTTYKEVPATGHSYGKVVTAPTCTEKGYTTYTCACGDTYVADEVAATGHTEATAIKENEKAATCYAEGSYEEVVYCSVCKSHEISRVTKTTEKLAHTPAAAVEENRTESTCTKAGFYESVIYCSVEECKAEISRTKVDMPLAEHTEGEAKEENRKEPTYNAAGSYDMVVRCTACSAELSRESFVIPMLEGVAKVGDTNYGTLVDAVNAANAGDTLVLLKNITGAGVVIDKSITIDFDDHTYTFNKAVGSTGTVTLGFQILKGHNVVLKSGKLTSTKVTEGKEVKILIQNYSNLTLTDMVLDGTNENILYGLSNNSGAIALNGATSITVHDSAVAFDVYDYSSAGYAVPEMTVNTTGTITGKIKVSETATLAISDGNFSVKPESDWCAEGYGPNIEDVNGYYGVHKHVEVIDAAKEATCTATGLTEGKHCSVCNGVLVAQTVIDALGHEMAHNDAVAPDCTNDGTVEYWYCSVCNKNFSDEEGSTELTSIVDGKLGHKFAEELSYDENGHWYACTRTGCTEKKDAENHAWDHACDTDCNDGCGYTRTITHSYTEASEEVVIEANCVTNAVYKAKCAVCGDVSDTERITGTTDATKHTGKTDVRGAKDATCVAMGYTGDTHCSDCNELLTKGTAIEMLTTHTYPDTWTQTKAPTCTEKGSEYRQCTVEGCESTETRDIAMVAHTTSYTAAKDATCAETGNYEYWYCSVCKGYFKNEQGTEAYAENAWVIEKTDHIFETTYTTDGQYHWYKCTNSKCDVVNGKATHTYGDQWKHDDDDHWHECVCGDKADLAEHGWDAGVVTTQPTISAEGVKTYTCGTCGATRTETIDKLTGTTVSLDVLTNNLETGPRIALLTGTTAGEGWDKEGNVIAGSTVDFSVTFDKACVVIVETTDTDGNLVYTKVPAVATADKNTYTFSTNVVEGMKIIVAVKGDITGDGAISGRDASAIKKWIVGKYDADELKLLVTDVTEDNAVSGRDASAILKQMVGKFEWNW